MLMLTTTTAVIRYASTGISPFGASRVRGLAA